MQKIPKNQTSVYSLQIKVEKNGIFQLRNVKFKYCLLKDVKICMSSVKDKNANE